MYKNYTMEVSQTDKVCSVGYTSQVRSFRRDLFKLQELAYLILITEISTKDMKDPLLEYYKNENREKLKKQDEYFIKNTCPSLEEHLHLQNNICYDYDVFVGAKVDVTCAPPYLSLSPTGTCLYSITCSGETILI